MKIVIFQPMLKQYRLSLFEKMGTLLKQQGHELRVVCGTPFLKEITRNDNVLNDGPYWIIQKSHWFFNDRLHYLPHALSHMLWADLIITEQANKHLHNYLLIILKFLGIRRFAYWGHGQNRQGNSNSWSEKVKKRFSTYCDWWFAYTQGVADYLEKLGYPAEKITNLNNSVDTSEFKKILNRQAHAQLAEFKTALGIPEKSKVGLYCGGLYAEKKIDFLLEAALQIHAHCPDFVLLIVGAGKDGDIIRSFSTKHSFVKYLGPLFGSQKALAFKTAALFLCPGLVGLAIIDAFTAGLPIMTTDVPFHSPEIEYLQPGHNGEITPHIADVYARTIIDIFNDSTKLARLKEHAFVSGSRFSIENMAAQFCEGINSFCSTLNP